MGQDVEGILEYFKGSPATFADYMLIVVVILLILIVVFLALREIHLRKIAGSEDAYRRMLRPPRRVKRWREEKGIGKGTARRKNPRLESQFPVNVGTPDGSAIVDADILDVSAGGVRLGIIGDPLKLTQGQILDVTSTEPPLDIMGTAQMEVLSTKWDSELSMQVVNGRWTEMDRIVGKALAREVRHQLNLIAEEEYEKNKTAEEEKQEEKAAKEAEEKKRELEKQFAEGRARAQAKAAAAVKSKQDKDEN